MLALLLFLVLDAQRRRAPLSTAAVVRTQANTFTDPPALVVPPEPAPVQTVATLITVPAPAPPPAFRSAPPSPRADTVLVPTYRAEPDPPTVPLPPPERAASRSAVPALVIDEGAQQGVTPTPAGSNGAARPAGSAGSDDTPARAALIGNKATVMPTGTLIPAVLETPIDTARPGLVRAVVSQDARGFDGRRVLVPRGSRLIGEYQADIRSGQDRVLVTWTRLIRPDGVAIRLGSPAADPLGGAGVPGKVHSFFFERFASAVLQSALTVGVNLASRPRSGSVIVGLQSGQITNTIGQGLLPNDLRPKITVKQGAALNVFVARDLDFSGVATRP